MRHANLPQAVGMVSARSSTELLSIVTSSREGTGMTSVERTLSRRIEWTQYNAIGREACFLPVLARGAAREVCNRAFAIREERVDD
jgi:hypothetical protein